MSRIHFVSILVLLGCAGCAPDSGTSVATTTTTATTTASAADADAAYDPAAIARSEAQLETLSEFVRSLRDRNPQLMFPTEAEFEAALEVRFPTVQQRQEILRDAWGRPFRYEIFGDRREYRLRSFGPNGVDDGGHGDDAPMRGGKTDIGG